MKRPERNKALQGPEEQRTEQSKTEAGEKQATAAHHERSRKANNTQSKRVDRQARTAKAEPKRKANRRTKKTKRRREHTLEERETRKRGAHKTKAEPHTKKQNSFFLAASCGCVFQEFALSQLQ